MNSNQIQCFLNAARRLSLTAAAADMFLSPQAVSKQVIALEEDLGLRLFERNGPRLTLTESGKLFYNLFSGMGRQLHFVLDDIRLYHESRKMELSVGVSEWIDPSGNFLEGVSAFRSVHPGCKVSMSVFSNLELQMALDSGKIDCAFFSGAQVPPGAAYQSEVVAQEEIFLYAPSDIPAGPAREDCWGLPLLMTPAWNWTDTELRIAGAREMTGVRLSPAETVQLPNLQSLYAMIEFSRCTTLGGSRFNYLSRIPGLTGHATGAWDSICCLWPRQNGNTLAPQLAKRFRLHFSEHPDSQPQ